MSRAVVQLRSGGPETLWIGEVHTPDPGPDEVVVRVRAAAINPYDAKVMSGRIPVADPPLPRGVGTDVAGEVIAVGPGAVHLDGGPVAVGDHVMGWTTFSSLREELCLPASSLVRRPANVPWAVAGGLATAGLAAAAAMNVLQPGPDDIILVSAAGGAVGLIGCQLARRRGAAVIGTASERKHELLRSLGVLPVTYGPDLAERIDASLRGIPTGVVDNAGRETIDTALAMGVPPSRIVTVVDHAAINEFGLAGVGPYRRSASELAALAAAVASGSVTVPIAATFELDDVAAAFVELASARSAGKIVVLM